MKLTEEEFLKEHPGLKEHIRDFSKDSLTYSDRTGYTKFVGLGWIHETQIDKIKHKEIMKKREHIHQINLQCARDGAKEKTLHEVEKVIKNFKHIEGVFWKEQLKKELGLK